MNRILLVVLGAALHFGVGCATPSNGLSKTQVDAIQVRDIEASTDRAFAAATNAVLDAGFTVEVTDGEGGLLSAVRREDPSAAEHAAIIAVSTVLTLGQAPTMAKSRLYGVGIQVLPRQGGLSSVRIRPFGHSSLVEEQKEIQQLWTLMQRQVLIKEPVGGSGSSWPKAPSGS